MSDVVKKNMKTNTCYCCSKRCLNCIYLITTRDSRGNYIIKCKYDRKEPETLIGKVRSKLGI